MHFKSNRKPILQKIHTCFHQNFSSFLKFFILHLFKILNSRALHKIFIQLNICAIISYSTFKFLLSLSHHKLFLNKIFVLFFVHLSFFVSETDACKCKKIFVVFNMLDQFLCHFCYFSGKIFTFWAKIWHFFFMFCLDLEPKRWIIF